MSTILLYTSPARGHLYPMMDVALALEERGHRVVAQTLAAEEGAVSAAGVEHRAIDPRIEALRLDDYKGRGPAGQLKRTLATWADRAPIEVEDLRASIEAIQPDLLLIDANTWGAAALAEARDEPWAMFLPYVLPVPSRDAPPVGPGLRPPRGWPGRLRDRILHRLSAMVFREALGRLNALRAQLGVPPLAGFPDLFLRPEILLYRTAEPFDYPRSDWPANVRAIGPGLWAPPGEAPEWLNDLPRPRVLVSVSTELQEDGAIIETALEALRDEPGSIVVTTAALDPAAFQPPHERTRITRFLPHSEVIPQVDVVVTHGGMGTTQRALAAGVPVCVVPWGRDQSESARRAELSGGGTFVPRSRLSPQRLRRAVRETRARAPGAARIARAFREAGGGERGADLLEARIGNPSADGRPRHDERRESPARTVRTRPVPAD